MSAVRGKTGHGREEAKVTLMTHLRRRAPTQAAALGLRNLALHLPYLIRRRPRVT